MLVECRLSDAAKEWTLEEVLEACCAEVEDDLNK